MRGRRNHAVLLWLKAGISNFLAAAKSHVICGQPVYLRSNTSITKKNCRSSNLYGLSGRKPLFEGNLQKKKKKNGRTGTLDHVRVIMCTCLSSNAARFWSDDATSGCSGPRVFSCMANDFSWSGSASAYFPCANRHRLMSMSGRALYGGAAGTGLT